MTRWVIVGAVLLLAASVAASRPEDRPQRGFFATLKPGQSVALKDVGESYVISTVDEPLPMTHEVVEVGEDFIVLKDATGLAETRIPIYAVKAVAHLRARPRRAQSIAEKWRRRFLAGRRRRFRPAQGEKIFVS